MRDTPGRRHGRSRCAVPYQSTSSVGIDHRGRLGHNDSHAEHESRDRMEGTQRG